MAQAVGSRERFVVFNLKALGEQDDDFSRIRETCVCLRTQPVKRRPNNYQDP